MFFRGCFVSVVVVGGISKKKINFYPLGRDFHWSSTSNNPDWNISTILGCGCWSAWHMTIFIEIDDSKMMFLTEVGDPLTFFWHCHDVDISD